MKIDLKNQVILVTGATRGIGRQSAKMLAEAGASIAVHYRSQEEEAHKLAQEFGNNSKAFYADLQTADDFQPLFNDVLEHFGELNSLVNNAGVFIESQLDDNNWGMNWDKTLDINLKAVAILSRLAIIHFKKIGGGRIINIASRAAFRGDTEDYLAYAASKGGMVALSRSIARAFGKDNIKSFVIAPGFVKTDMALPHFKKVGEEGVTAEMAIKAITTPKDIAPTVVFLASGLMDHATGCAIDINGASYVR